MICLICCCFQFAERPVSQNFNSNKVKSLILQQIYMSFFDKIFGGDKEEKKKTTQAPPKPAEDSPQMKKLQIIKAFNALDTKIEEFDDKQKKFDHKIDIIKQKAKELLEADKKKQARKYAQEATKIAKQKQSYTLRKKALQDKKFQLEQTLMDMETIYAIEGALQHTSGAEKFCEKLGDLILDVQEAIAQQQEINQQIKGLVEDEEQDEQIDDMLDEIMGDIQKEKKKKIEEGKQIGVSIPQKQTIKAKKEEDDIANMLADLN